MHMPSHQVIGLYPTRAAAASARGRLFWRDIAPDQVCILAPGANTLSGTVPAPRAEVHPEMVRDALVAAALGALMAGFALLALASWGALGLGAAPWPTALSVVALGAVVGLPCGALAGRPQPDLRPPPPIDSALRSGRFVLLVRAHGEAQASMVRELLGPMDH